MKTEKYIQRAAFPFKYHQFNRIHTVGYQKQMQPLLVISAVREQDENMDLFFVFWQDAQICCVEGKERVEKCDCFNVTVLFTSGNVVRKINVKS